MRLKLLLPRVVPDVFEEPTACPYGCGSKQFHLRQEVGKPVRDTVYREVTARRYDCLRCGRTFRVYPKGINDDQTSQRLKGLAVLFYIMGLSYGAVALVLNALGHPLGKTAVYYAVQAAGEKVNGLRQEEVRVSTVCTQERQPTPQAAAKLEEIHRRYAQAPSPAKLRQPKESLAYRMRLFSLDRWNLWRRLTLYRDWQGPNGERMDGTNNATERSIGWRVKERYRTMRGYKRPQSALNVSRLIAWAANFLDAGGADLAAVIA